MFWDYANGGYIANGGKSLKAYWDRALTAPPGATGAVITYDWYYDFLKFLRDGGHYEWFSWLITFGEMAVGLGLIFGCLTAIAAFFGTIMNLAFGLAGTASTNPVMFALSALVILAWRVSGWWGLDRYVLPALGTPWQAGILFRRSRAKLTDEDTRVPPTGVTQA
jgi:thiosulfate dehydrogenase [quinone] large subunit